MTKETNHYVSDIEGQAFCGRKIKQREWGKRQTAFLCGRKEVVTCKYCLKKLKEEEDIQKKMDEYRKELEKQVDDRWDDYRIGYSEAIFNLLGEFANGQCEDCSFSYAGETHSPDFCLPEGTIECSLERCWITSVKEIIRNRGKK